MLFGESLWTALIVQYHILAVSLVFGKICKICSTGWFVHTFSVLHGLCCLLEIWLARVLKVSDTNWLPCPVEMMGWLSFIFISHFYVLNTLKTQILYEFLYVVTIDLWSLFCVLLSLFRGYIPSSFLWFVNMRLQSSCLLVTTFSLHHCIWDCRPVLSLTAFPSYWLLS